MSPTRREPEPLIQPGRCSENPKPVPYCEAFSGRRSTSGRRFSIRGRRHPPSAVRGSQPILRRNIRVSQTPGGSAVDVGSMVQAGNALARLLTPFPGQSSHPFFRLEALNGRKEVEIPRSRPLICSAKKARLRTSLEQLSALYTV